MQEHFSFVTSYKHQLVMFAPQFEVERLMEVPNGLLFKFAKQEMETDKNNTKVHTMYIGKKRS